jgi:hypothetical protein
MFVKLSNVFDEKKANLFQSFTPKFTLRSEISGCHGGEYEDGCLLGCCAV